MTDRTTKPNARAARALALAASLAGGAVCPPVAPAAAQTEKSAPEELLEEGTRQILRAFELFISTIPQYEMPEVLPNGDIIIRRKNPLGGDAPKPDAVPEGGAKTKT